MDRPAPDTVALHHLPGRPRRRLCTGVRSGAGRQPAVQALRAALGAAPRGTVTARD